MAKKGFSKVSVDDYPIPGDSLTPVENAESATQEESDHSEEDDTSHSPGWILVPIDDIEDSFYQTREKQQGEGNEKFQRLVKSMKEHGPDGPINVHRNPDTRNLQVTAGGHSRLGAAKKAGLTKYPVIIVPYDARYTALGTAWENLARQDLTPLEEGELYLKIRQSQGFNREELAEELGISPDRIKECEALARSSDDIKEMIRRIGAEEGNAERGLRAAKHLRRLDELDKRQQGLAVRLRAPLVDAFVYERIKTNEVDIAVKRILAADDPEEELSRIIRSISQQEEQEDYRGQEIEKGNAQKPNPLGKEPTLQRTTKLVLLTRNFHIFEKLVGDAPLSNEERRTFQEMRQKIDTILNR
jgi:ParB/RepB/Spo0J family partition protein